MLLSYLRCLLGKQDHTYTSLPSLDIVYFISDIFLTYDIPREELECGHDTAHPAVLVVEPCALVRHTARLRP